MSEDLSLGMHPYHPSSQCFPTVLYSHNASWYTDPCCFSHLYLRCILQVLSTFGLRVSPFERIVFT